MIARFVTPSRFNRGVALAAAAAIVVLGLLIVAFSETAFRDQRRRDLDIQTRIISESVTAPLMFADAAATQDYVDALATNPQIADVLIFDSNHRIVASFRRSGAATPDVAPTAHPAVFDGPIVHAAASVQRNGERYGLIYLAMARDPWILTVGRYAPLILLFSMAALVLLVAGAAQEALSRVNTELAAKAEALSATNSRLAEEIAQRKEAEEALLQSRKMETIGQLTGGVAHDFNNLLMIISGGLRMMDGKDEARRTRMLDAMRQAVDRGATLTRQLLAFSRRQPMRMERVDTHARIEGMREILERSIRADIILELAVPNDIPPVETDPGLFELAIINLAVNARDAMPKGGVLTISARLAPDPEFVEVTVTDTGTGIPPDILDRIFEPYFTTKQIGQGTGLGLSQVYGFAKQSGGEARIISEVGVGTRVVLKLPVSHAPATSHDAPAEAISTTPEPLRVLVVEDDDAVAQTVNAMLEELGHTVLRMPSARDALEVLATDKAFDLVFSDIVMPGGMNGIEFAKTLETTAPEIPVLLTTGYSGRQDVELGRPLLRKPYHIDDLGRAIAGFPSSGGRRSSGAIQ